jgi:outer membrane protein assembly factor BamD (BamD/ComL family)
MIAAALLLGVGLIGCGDNHPSAQQSSQLSSGFRALDEHQYNAAIQSADDYLRQQPSGPGAAEALYLKGRGYEQKPAADPAEMKRNLDEARTAYLDALNQNPSPKTEGYIRASLSNVAFFQDDYATAQSEASQAMKLVGDSPEIQSVLLYRIGVSQQRLGLFTDADSTFAQVQQRYPGSSIADRAREHEGKRVFFVQLATYNTPNGAERATDGLKASGVVISTRSDNAGHTVINAGPFPTYEDAKQAKAKFTAQFPDALITP